MSGRGVARVARRLNHSLSRVLELAVLPAAAVYVVVTVTVAHVLAPLPSLAVLLLSAGALSTAWDRLVALWHLPPAPRGERDDREPLV